MKASNLYLEDHEIVLSEANAVAFDRRNRQHVEALADFANGLLSQLNQNGEPMRLGIDSVRGTEREILLAAIDQVGHPATALKINFTLPLEGNQSVLG